MSLQICATCGGAMLNGEACGSCVAIALEAEVEEEKKRLEEEKPEERVDFYRELEDQMRAARLLREELLKEMGQEWVKDNAKLKVSIAHRIGSLNAGISKLAEQALKFQQARSRIASTLTPEEQIAQIVRWFERLAGERRKILLDQLVESYNDTRRRQMVRKEKRDSWVKRFVKSPESA